MCFSLPLLQVFSTQGDRKVQFPHFNPDPFKVRLFSYFNQHSFVSLGRGSTLPYAYRVRRCYSHCHTKEVRGDGSDLSHLHFFIKMLMDHSRKSLQSFRLLLLDVILDILGTSMTHLCLVSASGEQEVGYIQCLLSATRFCRLQFPLSLNLGLKSTVLLS